MYEANILQFRGTLTLGQNEGRKDKVKKLLGSLTSAENRPRRMLSLLCYIMLGGLS